MLEHRSASLWLAAVAGLVLTAYQPSQAFAQRHHHHHNDHDSGHWDYHPGHMQQHNDHYDFVPGHYDWHQTHNHGQYYYPQQQYYYPQQQYYTPQQTQQYYVPQQAVVQPNPLPAANPLPRVAQAGGVMAGGTIRIVNPATSGQVLQYTLNNTAYTIQPGQTQTLTNDRAWTIAFDRGGHYGQSRYSLSTGTYNFTSTGQGWNLFRSTGG